jgi:hypothetical protein
MIGCLRFSAFVFWILPNLAKYTYGWSPLEQHHKILKKNTSAAASGAVTQKSVANPTRDYDDNPKHMWSYFPQPTKQTKVQIYCFDRTNTQTSKSLHLLMMDK